MRSRRACRTLALLALPLAHALACLPGRGPALREPPEAGLAPVGALDDDGGPSPRQDVDLGDSFAIYGVSPSRGPFSGGTRIVVRGRGFPTKLRVFVGGKEVPSSDVVASDPTRAAILAPPNAPGAADVVVRDDAAGKERTLAKGFLYEPLVVEPDTGATSGGTRIALRGSGTAWADGATVAVGGAPCADVRVVGPERIECTTGPQAPGAKDVVVTSQGGVEDRAREAFTYSDSPDGFRGGLSGGLLSGSLRVLALDAATGAPLEGARVIVGGDLASATVKITDASGVVQLASPAFAGKATVTVAAKCHQPLTFVDVPVDTVTAYLPAVLDLACAEGDPPSTGGRPGRYAAEITGELVWPGGIELQRAEWRNVPLPVGPRERQAAYLFVASGSPLDSFVLPDGASAVTLESDGRAGYGYSLVTFPGNQTIYAVAGVEDRSFTPPRFTAYAMGIARGVSAQPATRTPGVDIAMDIVLDHTLTLAPSPPAVGPRGPDTLRAQVAVELTATTYAILPALTKARPLPYSDELAFSFVPPLAGSLASYAYVVSASASTGAQQQPPASVISRLRVSDTAAPVAVGGFLPVPALEAPAAGSWSGRDVRFTESATYDLAMLTVSSAGGLVSWTVIAPGASAAAREIALPDLASAVLGPDALGLRRGPIQSTLYVARIPQFAYGRLRTGQLQTGAWGAHAIDAQTGAY